MTSTEATAPPRPTAAQAVIVGLLSMLVMVIDGYDMGAMPIVVPHLAPLWGVQPATFGLALSAVVIGLGLGAFLLAPLGDRFGRRVTTVASLAVISLATIGTGLAPSPAALFWWRLLTGTGLGACLPNVLAILAQIIPAERRASAMTIVSCGIPIGAAGAGAVVPWLTRAHGWQAAFFAPGVLMLVMTLVVALYLSRIPLPVTAPRAVRAWTDIPIFAPLRRGLVIRTAIFCGLFCFNALSMYAITSWLPTVLKRAGFTFENASWLAAIVQLGGLFGGLLLATQIDRHRTIAALLAGYALVALALVSLSVVAPSFGGWGFIMLLIGMGVGGAHIALPAVAANIYPATMLSAGIGLAVTVARLGAVAGSMAGAALIGANVSSGGFFLALLVPVGLCALCVLAFAAARLANGPSEQALAEQALAS